MGYVSGLCPKQAFRINNSEVTQIRVTLQPAQWTRNNTDSLKLILLPLPKSAQDSSAQQWIWPNQLHFLPVWFLLLEKYLNLDENSKVS